MKINNIFSLMTTLGSLGATVHALPTPAHSLAKRNEVPATDYAAKLDGLRIQLAEGSKTARKELDDFIDNNQPGPCDAEENKTKYMYGFDQEDGPVVFWYEDVYRSIIARVDNPWWIRYWKVDNVRDDSKSLPQTTSNWRDTSTALPEGQTHG